MSILDKPGKILNDAKAFIENPFQKKVDFPVESDFKEGFTFVEIVDGKRDEELRIRLMGNNMPIVPFGYGGTQNITKERYVGNPEPTVQVLGAEESDLTIKGRFYDKRYRDTSLRGVAYEITEAIEAIRLRGKLLEIQMGEYRRYGFLETTKFNMKTLADIEYELTFMLIGFNPPERCNQVDIDRQVPFDVNLQLVDAAEAFQSTYSNIPEFVPQTIGDFINGVVSDVAEVVTTVTSFINGPFSTLDDINDGLARAQGVIRFGQSELFRAKRRLGSISLGVAPYNELPIVQKTRTRNYVHSAVGGLIDLSALLAQLRDRFAFLKQTTPQARHRIRQGDSLQKLAVKYYGDQKMWENIYDHNELDTTELETGKILEIPRV